MRLKCWHVKKSGHVLERGGAAKGLARRLGRGGQPHGQGSGSGCKEQAEVSFVAVTLSRYR